MIPEKLNIRVLQDERAKLKQRISKIDEMILLLQDS